jgi:hypothetical protein
MSPRRNWNSPNPSLAIECAPLSRTGREGAHLPAGEGWGSPNSADLRKSVTLYLLCAVHCMYIVQVCRPERIE